MAGAPTGATMATVGDLTVQPGVRSAYHLHPNTEESIFVVDGEIEFRLGNSKFRASSGDCVLAPKGIGHGLENIGRLPARLITIYPSASPEREVLSDVVYDDVDPGPGVFVRGNVEPYEFSPGVSRYDMVGDFLGSLFSRTASTRARVRLCYAYAHAGNATRGRLCIPAGIGRRSRRASTMYADCCHCPVAHTPESRREHTARGDPESGRPALFFL